MDYTMKLNRKKRRLSELSPEAEPYPDQYTNGYPSNDPQNQDTAPTKRQKPHGSIAYNSECWDWMITTGNVHYARTTNGFVSYTPLREPKRLRRGLRSDHIPLCDGNNEGEEELEVRGIGRVDLAVQRSSSSGLQTTTDTDTHTILFENVLHVPDAICNGFSPLVFGGGMSCNEDIWVGGDGAWTATPFAGGMRLVLAGGRKGGSEVVDGGFGYSFGMSVSPAEWEEILAAVQEGYGGRDARWMEE